MRFDWRQLFARLLFAALALFVMWCLLIMTGCSWSAQTRTQTNDRSRIQGTAAGVPVDVVVERQVEAQEQTSGETRAPAIAAMASQVATGTSLGGPVGGLLGLITGAATAWFASKGTMKTLRDQLEYHKKDAEEGWQKADERALKLPPT